MASTSNKKFVVLLQGDGTLKDNKYIECLEKEGFRVKCLPVLSFNFINQEKLHENLCNSANYSGIIFTSTRSVSAVSASLKSSRDFIEKWKSKTNFSVGKATAQSAFSVLNLDTYGSDSGSSEKLCHIIIENYGHLDKPLLYPCSTIRKDTILTTLTENCIAVDEIFCYETIPNKDFENLWTDLVSVEGLPDIVIFFSPSGIQCCKDTVTNSYQKNCVTPKFIAIGPSTEKAVLDFSIHFKYQMAEKPTPEYVMKVVRELIVT